MHRKKYIEILQILETEKCQKYIYNPPIFTSFLLQFLLLFTTIFTSFPLSDSLSSCENSLKQKNLSWSFCHNKIFIPFSFLTLSHTRTYQIDVHVLIINFGLHFRPAQLYSILYVYYFFFAFSASCMMDA